MTIGERIADLRKEKNISQGQLAQALDLTRQAVSKWENDLTSPDTIHLIKLADLLDTDIEYLTTGRRSFGRRPPVVLETEKIVEKVVEVPVVEYVDRIVEKPVEKPVIQYVEKPIIKKKVHIKYVRNPIEFAVIGIICFVIGLLVGALVV